MDYTKILAIGFIFAVAIMGIYMLKQCGPYCELETTGNSEICDNNRKKEGSDEINMKVP
jgi:hypothetical protein